MNNPLVELDKSELERLQELSDVYHTSTTPGWLRILDFMRDEVETAHESMVGNLSNEPMTYMRLQLRWQQREALLRAVETYVGSCNEQRQQMLEEIEERKQEREGTHTSYGEPS